MKPNKYNPQIPNKFDGQGPLDWKFRHYELRVTLYVTPVRMPWQFPPHLRKYQAYARQYLAFFPTYDYDYETPHGDTIEALEQLMPGSYQVVSSDDFKTVTVYCDEWIDRVVIRLARDPEKPTALDRAQIEYRRKPSRRKVNYLVKSLISSL
jgi:hypothetical protein